MKPIVDIFLFEFTRYKELGRKTLEQMTDDDLNKVISVGNNSVAMIVRHISGNLISRFTDFLTSDGEKSWRNRDAEFEEIQYTRNEIEEMWNKGWEVLQNEVGKLSDTHLEKQVYIRGLPFTVADALARSVAHTAHHIGQIVTIARILKSDEWQWISIPKGESKRFFRL